MKVLLINISVQFKYQCKTPNSLCMMNILVIQRLEPSRWPKIDMKNIDWNVYLNTLFWNLNYWESISTLAGEVENPKKTIPKSLYCVVMLVVGTYFISLLSATSSIESQWNVGYFADIAKNKNKKIRWRLVAVVDGSIFYSFKHFQTWEWLRQR